MPLTGVGKWTLVYGLVAAEVAAIGGAYYTWRGLNRSQGSISLPTCKFSCTITMSVADAVMLILHPPIDYRKWMYHHHPRILDSKILQCVK